MTAGECPACGDPLPPDDPPTALDELEPAEVHLLRCALENLETAGLCLDQVGSGPLNRWKRVTMAGATIDVDRAKQEIKKLLKDDQQETR